MDTCTKCAGEIQSRTNVNQIFKGEIHFPYTPTDHQNVLNTSFVKPYAPNMRSNKTLARSCNVCIYSEMYGKVKSFSREK